MAGSALSTPGARYSIWRIHGLGSLGLLEAWCGDLARAEAFSDQALTLAQEGGHLGHQATADAYLARALVALERGEPSGAALSLHEGRRRAEANRRRVLLWVAAVEQAQLDAGSGRWDEAASLLREAEATMGVPPPVVGDRALALRARVLRLGDQPLEARHLLGEAPPASAPVAFERAAAALALGDSRMAVKLAGASPDLSAPAEPVTAVQSLLLSAWIAHLEGAPGLAQVQLAEAMELAAGHGLVETVALAGPVLIDLMARLPGPTGFRTAVLARTRMFRQTDPGQALVDPLTSRELEVLSHLPSRLTNAELAIACFVSVNTVKTHVAHIYRKLGVTSRNHAVERARELGLL